MNIMPLTSPWEVFLVGTVGGCLLELLHWYALKRDERLPPYIRNPFYWVVSALMALTGGLLALLYFGGAKTEAITALHVGLSAPLMLQKFASTLAERPGARSGTSDRLLAFIRW